MIQLTLIALCGIGCLATLVSIVGSLVACLRQSIQGTPFLTPVPVPPTLARDGEPAFLPFGLVQVYQLAERLPTPLQADDEVQA